MSKNKNLHAAKRAKNDEFYTQMVDIENELKYYKDHFKGKTIFMNCDDPAESNFWKYFHLNFEFFGLKKIISTHYLEGQKSYMLEYEGGDDVNTDVGVKTNLEGDGDFRSEESINLLKESDIVVTNPPFSLMIPFMNQLMKYKKNFIIIASQNAITNKDIFPSLRDNKIWLGVHANGMEFEVPNKAPYNKRSSFRVDKESGKAYQKLGNVCRFTNLEHYKRTEELILWKSYNEEDNPKYDNYNAVEVSRVKEIPEDYFGVMGVPITFLNKYNPNQFEIISVACGNSWGNYKETLKKLNFKPEIKYGGGLGAAVLNGKAKYSRILIKRKDQKQ